jgi:hypothetical protein
MKVIKLSFKPLIFEVPSEREHLYKRIKALLERAEQIANTHENVKYRLKAMEVATRIAQFLAGVLKDVQLDKLEQEISKLESEEEA